MCGRFILGSPVDELIKEFGIERPSFTLKQSYNIAPGQTIPIIINDGGKRVVPCKWGYIPTWSKDPLIGNKMINARAETITEKKSFSNAFKKRRCLIITDGFYEWKAKDKVKFPFFTRLRSQKPFCMGGIYSNWTSPEGETFYTCSIITTGANELLVEVHHRMPVIIPKDRYGIWLDPAYNDTAKLLPLLRPYPADEMECYAVSTRVNFPKNNSRENIQPVQG
jgi:putative SOS response-associated peptidase YedK